MKKTKLYFLSGWIANLGVVPLFLSAAFLLTPIFFLLKALLFFVTRVLETMFYSLSFVSKGDFLSIFTPNVKTVFLILTIYPIITHSKTSTIVLAIGEHKEIMLSNLKNYSITNNEVLSHRISKNSQTILIKGKKQGFAQLIIWPKKGQKEIFDIYILTKLKHMSIAGTARVLQSHGLKAQMNGHILSISGVIDSLENYTLFHQIAPKNKSRLNISGELSKKLKQEIIGEVYLQFFTNYSDDIKCFTKNFFVYCKYKNYKNVSNEIIHHLKNKYFIKFIKTHKSVTETNFKVRLRIFHLESHTKNDIELGFAEINQKLSLIIEEPFSVIQDKLLKMSESKFKIKNIAKPEALLTLNTPLTVKIGASIPTTQVSNNSTTTSWKFAGFKLSLEMEKKSNGYLLKYKNEMSQFASDKKIVNNNTSGKFYIDLTKKYNFFSVDYTHNSYLNRRLPYIGQIPVFGILFNNSNSSKTYNKIFGIISVEPYGI